MFKRNSSHKYEEMETEALQNAETTLAQVIAFERSHLRDQAIDAIKSLEMGWKTPTNLSHKLAETLTARHRLLGGYRRNTDVLPRNASDKQHKALMALDNLIRVVYNELPLTGPMENTILNDEELALQPEADEATNGA